MEKQATQQSKEKLEKVNKTDAEWRQQLSDQEYQVTRKKGTEPAFTGKYWNTAEARGFRVRLLRRAALRFGDQIRFRDRLAKLLCADG